MSITCKNCGQTWARDPRLEVLCPTCLQPIGRKCRRPSGHDCEIHIEREQAAVDAGFLSATCPKSPQNTPPADNQSLPDVSQDPLRPRLSYRQNALFAAS